MFPLEGMSIDCITLIDQYSPLDVAISLILNPRLRVSDHGNMAKQLEPLVPILLVKPDKCLDDVGLLELGVLLGEEAEAGLGLAYVQMLPLLRS